MDISRQLLFFFSALGAFNGFLLSFYFGFLIKNRRKSDIFLSGLLFVVSTRIAKSVFFFFTNNLAEIYIQIGLSALLLIGPLLYLYADRAVDRPDQKPANWLLHLLPPLIVMSIICYLYSYRTYREFWDEYIRVIYYIWLVYILITGYQLRGYLKKLFTRGSSMTNNEVWVLSIFFGVTFIWVGYRLGSYTSYIVGALCFSFVLYLLVLLLFTRGRRQAEIVEEPVDKYANKKIDGQEAEQTLQRLKQLMNEKELYQNSNLKLPEVADELRVPTHYLSQLLNDNLGKNFSLFVNEYRIEAAKKMLVNVDHLTLEAIGYDCGFNSKSTFYTTFKKIVGMTPAAYRKQHTS